MPRQLIISDLHLCEANAEATALFLKFLKQEAAHSEALYILGDLFEFWIGDDDLTPYHRQIINALANLKNDGTQLYIMHGNRDFLLGKRFCAMTHATLLPDASIITPYDQSLLLTHGDALCTDDVRYQRYRRWVDQRWLQWAFLKLPLTWRRRIAIKLRHSNPHAYRDDRPINQPDIADVNRLSVLNAFQQHQVRHIIHGHTHRYAIHYYPEKKQRIVLGDWHAYGSFVEITPNKLALHSL